MQNRNDAWSLLNEYTKSESLLKHALAVEAAMRWYGEHFKLSSTDLENWAICGLLHDFDYEQHPDPTPPDGHPYFGHRLLAELGYSEEIRAAIMGHAEYTGVARETQMAKTLFAVDELSGLITACALVRPDRSLFTLEAKSVKKKMKDKAFARGCNRDDIKLGAEELGIELTQHIENVINALRNRASQLGLAGNPTQTL
ncbi:MAG: hydrolase [Bdellovibrionales bacterium]|nr:hydrolase [Bdellovibrionales bacterium]